MFIQNHSLSGTFDGRSVKQLHCNKQSGHLEYPDMILLHYTAGGNALSSAHYPAQAENGSKIILMLEAQETSGTATADDSVYAGFYETVQKSSRLLKIGERRTSTSAEFVLPKKWVAANVKVYAFAVSKSKHNASDTLYLELMSY